MKFNKPKHIKAKRREKKPKNNKVDVLLPQLHQIVPVTLVFPSVFSVFLGCVWTRQDEEA